MLATTADAQTLSTRVSVDLNVMTACGDALGAAATVLVIMAVIGDKINFKPIFKYFMDYIEDMSFCSAA